jgi:hypothetical protein
MLDPTESINNSDEITYLLLLEKMLSPDVGIKHSLKRWGVITSDLATSAYKSQLQKE